VADVVFPCGWVVEGDEMRVYYGAADSSMALATASVSETLDWLRRHSASSDRELSRASILPVDLS
jgi:predicted GH43/DUF377 family glycosyl hydrolase